VLAVEGVVNVTTTLAAPSTPTLYTIHEITPLTVQAL
jgi:hypothetical protein